MRFVKTPKPSTSLVTTRGHYFNSKGKVTHHRRMAETPINFIGVDGEGMNINGEHRYVLFGIGDKQIEDTSGLLWTDVFNHLYTHHVPGTAYVGFFLGYDFTQILKTMPEDKVWMLITAEGRALRKHRIPGKSPHPVQTDGWQFDMLAMKRLRIRPKLCDCPYATCKCQHAPWMYVCDVGSFFQASFLSVINPSGWATGTEVVSTEEYALIEEGKGKRSTAVLDDDMRLYNRLENQVLSRVMHTLDVGFHGIKIHLPASKWFGPGQAAQAWLKNEGVPKRAELENCVPPWFSEAARMAYFGGWFEIMMHGIIPGVTHEYDINSAYPSIIAQLPCLVHGTYSHGEGIPPLSTVDTLTLAYAKVWSPSMPDTNTPQHIGAMLHRDSGQILRPMGTEGWFWWDELQAAQRAKLIKRLDNKGKQQVIKWVQYTPCDCPPPMAEIAGLYLKRLEVGKRSPLGKAAKLAYNSEYGKFAQSVGEPVFGNAVYASKITSGCRTMILNAIATHPKGKANVAMIATDGIYFLDKHPELTISEALGEWDYKERYNLTLFKPGVYWDDTAREKIAAGGSPHFKARGFKAADFTSSIARIDAEFSTWDNASEAQLSSPEWQWPTVKFTPSFVMTTALQALRRNKWESAGAVSTGIELEQNADPYMKRDGLYRDVYNGRTIYRSEPHSGMQLGIGELEWIPSEPYAKRFGMEDPWSDEYRAQLGETPDGAVVDILAWILNGE